MFYFIQVNIKSKDFAVISRHSINNPTENDLLMVDGFQSPYFVFEQQVSF